MVSMERADAARLLGVPLDAGPQAVRRAFRLWAAVAHPDQGGSAEAFARLHLAREVLLTLPQADDHESLPPRRPWSSVLVRPSLADALPACAAALAAVAMVPVATGASLVWGLTLAALLATVTSVLVSRAVLRAPDHGHVIVARALVWLAVVIGQLGAAAAFGVPMLEALPLMAVPFVAAIAMVNPGAGLWRSVGR